MPEFIDAHGIAIVYDVHPAKTTPRAVVQLLHGVGEHAGRYGALIDALTARRLHGVRGRPARPWPHGHEAARRQRREARAISGAGACGRRSRRSGSSPRSSMTRTRTCRSSSSVTRGVVHRADARERASRGVRRGSSCRGSAYCACRGGSARADRTSRGTGPTRRVPSGSRPISRSAPPSSTIPHDRGSADQALRLPISCGCYGRPRKNLGHDIPTLLLVGRDDTVGGPRSVHKLADAYRTRSGLTDITTLVYPGAGTRSSTRSCRRMSAPTCSPGSTSGSRARLTAGRRRSAARAAPVPPLTTGACARASWHVSACRGSAPTTIRQLSAPTTSVGGSMKTHGETA